MSHGLIYTEQRIETLLAQNHEQWIANKTAVLVELDHFIKTVGDVHTSLKAFEPHLAALQAKNTRLNAENARLMALLAQEDVDVHDAPGQAGGHGDAAVIGQSTLETAWLSSPMHRPPREGMLFSNGGPYNGRDGNATVKRELNSWTHAHGYSVRVMRSNLVSRGRVKLTIGCNHARRPREQGTTKATVATPWRVGTEIIKYNSLSYGLKTQQEMIGGRYRTSHARDCPLRFMLLQLEPGSGTFVVQHAHKGNATSQRCNHEPDYAITAALEPEDTAEEAE